ncbi:helix-turn-helix domain-containing protein [Halocynthiibacter namhaensis]|uniref:helix-turn-helix domain-containing protein n=1 Tax=Halocynthiibacter namhaensis TaxID=1290553 RepID=UPI00138E3DFF|nr:helix-turn-helix domain-containing protein [Halocynthiibacter namhaensis]
MDQPTGQAYDAWHSQMTESAVPWQLDRPSSDSFSMDFSSAAIGSIGMTNSQFSSCEGYRSKREIQRSEDAYYSVQFMIDGHENVSSNEHRDVLSPGDAYLWDSEDEFSFQTINQIDSYSIRIPKFVFSGQRGGVEPSQRKANINKGVAAVLFQVVRSSFLNSGLMSPSENHVAQDVITSLVKTVFCASQADYRVEAPRKLLLQRVQNYIHNNLEDYSLSVETVARAQGISQRYLHSLFSDQALTFSGYVQHQRIESVKRDLANQLDKSTLTVIAQRYGFQESSHFSRVFKRATGITARDFRKSKA